MMKIILGLALFVASPFIAAAWYMVWQLSVMYLATNLWF